MDGAIIRKVTIREGIILEKKVKDQLVESRLVSDIEEIDLLTGKHTKKEKKNGRL